MWIVNLLLSSVTELYLANGALLPYLSVGLGDCSLKKFNKLEETKLNRIT